MKPNKRVPWNRINYHKGEKVGECFYLSDIDDSIAPSGKRHRKAKFRCPLCDNEFEALIDNVKYYKQISCGCYNSKKRFKHGLHKTKEYALWEAIVGRCYNPNDKNYHHYGGRGIRLCDEWRSNPESFYNYIINLENYGEKGYTLDRINNDGNYEPSNLRWADRHTQVANRGKQKSNTSGYVGVRVHKNKYASRITVRGNEIRLGLYSTKENAVTARNNYIIEHGLREYEIQEII